jgi:hypothetical protein
MFVQRDRGELFVNGTTVGDEPEAVGWVERVDPVTLETISHSGDLRAGGHEWCGSLAVHANGDLYTVNGSHLHRLAPDCTLVAGTELPVDHAHNGLLVLSDGSIVTKDIRLGDVPSTLTVCDPDLQVLASVELPEASMGRATALAGHDLSAASGSHSAVGDDIHVPAVGDDIPAVGDDIPAVGDDIYVPGTTSIFRYHWDGAALTRDRSWEPEYRRRDSGGLAWDTTVVDGRVWLMDNGSIPAIERRFSQVPTLRWTPGSARGNGLPGHPGWDEPVRALGISTEDATDVLRLVATEHPGGWVIAPPLVHDGVVIVWDTGNTGMAAFDIASGPEPEMLWFQPFRSSMQPLLFPDTGELVINDFRLLGENRTSDDIVVLDFRTGQMKSRVPTGASRMNGMFLTPGWDRDLYYCSFGTIARIRVVSL